MFEKLLELVNKLPEDQRAGFVAEVNALSTKNLVSKPTDLAKLIEDEQFTDLKKQFDSMLGGYRTKWEKEQTEKAIKDKTNVEPNSEEKNKENELAKLVTEALASIKGEISSLKQEKEVADLKTYAMKKAENLPEQFRGLIEVSAGMTQIEVDKKIDLFTKAHETYLKTIDQSPFLGKNKTVEGNVADWKESLPIKTKNNDKNAN
jgi:hypothetical protein